ncbi:MAG TPA: RNA polymerase sigma factor [Polyangiaceae bacterium]|nr:RNA polymerase sigma factor [Polyangiaceae bacterium]
MTLTYGIGAYASRGSTSASRQPSPLESREPLADRERDAPASEPPTALEPPTRSGVIHNPEPFRPPMDASQRDAWLAELLRLHHACVWRTLRRLGVSEDRADDAAQEVFIVASRKLDQIQPGRERNFLLSSALRVAANYRRSSRSRREVHDEELLSEQRDPGPDAAHALDQKRLRQLVDGLMESWPEELRTSFVLFEMEGLSVPEIAELTEAKTGTVASRLRRARELFLAGAKRLRARGLLDGSRL